MFAVSLSKAPHTHGGAFDMERAHRDMSSFCLSYVADTIVSGDAYADACDVLASIRREQRRREDIADAMREHKRVALRRELRELEDMRDAMWAEHNARSQAS